MNGCPVHELIHSQSFSIEEAEFLVRHANDFHVCDSCKFHFEKFIADEQKKAQGKPYKK